MLALPSERAVRFGGIVADSLCGGAGAQALLGANAPYPVQAAGINMTEDGPWLRLDAQPGATGHRHLSVNPPIRQLDVSTVRLQLRREQGHAHARYLMLQTGDCSGFYKCVFDCQELRLHSMEAHGPVKSLFAQIEQRMRAQGFPGYTDSTTSPRIQANAPSVPEPRQPTFLEAVNSGWPCLACYPMHATVMCAFTCATLAVPSISGTPRPRLRCATGCSLTARLNAAWRARSHQTLRPRM